MSLQRPALVRLRCSAVSAAVALVSFAATAVGQAPSEIRFNRDIRPILSENCFACHGPDAPARKADLRLDTKAGLFGKSKHAVAIVPGDPSKSEAVARVQNADPDEVMPPPKTGKKLTPEQVDLLKRWVEQGAKWEGHWAYSAPVRPVVPQVKRPE